MSDEINDLKTKIAVLEKQIETLEKANQEIKQQHQELRNHHQSLVDKHYRLNTESEKHASLSKTLHIITPIMGVLGLGITYFKKPKEDKNKTNETKN